MDIDTENEAITENFKNEKRKLDTNKASRKIQQLITRFTSFLLFFFDFIVI